MGEKKVLVVSLPDCLIIDIFSRLPAKSLCRFKCVSKFCLSFIQDPSFVHTIRPKTPFLWQIQLDNVIYLFSIDCNGVSTFMHSCSFGDDFERLGYLNGRYCNGLNCYLYNKDFGLYVCNVTTKECIALPRWCDNCMFCFDSSSNKYKVLGWVDKGTFIPLDFQILTLESDLAWRPVMNPLKMDYIPEPNVFINGEPFWLDTYSDEARIFSFNPANEEFRVISLPDEVHLETFWYCISEFEGSLILVEQLRYEGPMFSLWILNDNVWVMMKKNIIIPFESTNLYCRFSRNLQDYRSRPGIEYWRVDHLNFSSRGGEIVVAVVRDFDHQFIFMYNFLNNQFKTIKITGLPFFDFTMMNYMSQGYKMKNYVETNVSLQDWYESLGGRLLLVTEVVQGGDGSALEPVNL